MTRAGAFGFALVALASMPVAAPAQPQPQQSPPAATPLIEPALSADAAFARNIALIRADLLMADALVKERDWVDARPHADFPREEIYGVIRGDLRTYKTPVFDGALRELAHAVAARSVKRYDRASKKVQAALVAADVALKARQKDWPRFTLQVAAATLRDAADEYDDAVANGRIVHAVGYQTARGIVFETDRMVESVAVVLARQHAEAVQALRGNLIRLKDAFASVAAPKEPRADVDSVRTLIVQTAAMMRAIQ
jgi:hypothetical protein